MFYQNISYVRLCIEHFCNLTLLKTVPSNAFFFHRKISTFIEKDTISDHGTDTFAARNHRRKKRY